MSWFDTAGLTNFAKSALSTAQKTIDKALDIQEENSKKPEKKQPKKGGTESFFEAFGLNDKPSTSKSSEPETTENEKASSEPGSFQQDTAPAAEGQTYWGDSWGSFFEIPGQSPSRSTPTVSEPVKTKPPIDNKVKQDAAVLSQPHSARSFQKDSHPPQILTDTQSREKESNSTDVPESKPTFEDSSSAKPTYEDSLKAQPVIETSPKAMPCIQKPDVFGDNNKEVVTEQPSSDIASIANDQEVNKSNPPCLSTEKLDVKTPTLNEPGCDNSPSHSPVDNLNTVPDNNQDTTACELKIDVPEARHVDERDSKEIVLPISPPETKESNTKCDTQHIWGKDISESTMVISSGCLPPLDSSKINLVGDGSYDNSSSTLVIPDLPITVSQTVVNWECCALDDNSNDLYAVNENESSAFLVANGQSNENNSSPFHAISVDSFNNNEEGWSEANPTSSMMISESQHSSSGEKDSHHSDGSSNSSKDDDDTDTAEIKEYDSKSTSSSGSHTTSSSSFVKCSPEENDNHSQRVNSPVSTIASDRSDVAKQESEQTYSGDENETTTSSDIEILSPPNGENGDRNSSPLKHVWLNRPIRIRRSESPTSDSSKDSLMPVVNELEELGYEDERNSTILYDEKDPDGHKDYGDSGDIGMLIKKQDELQTILDAREKKIIELSKENIELQENEQRLKNLMQKMRVEQAKESRDITSLTREFTQKLSLVEGQLKEAVKDRDHLHHELSEAKQELGKRILATDFEEVIKEKDQQIKELTEEGQKLAKKELTHTTIIKKLRVKENEMDRTIKSHTERLEETSKEVERLRISIGAKEEQEKKHIDVIRNLNNAVKKLEKELTTLKSDSEDSLEKQHSLKKSLDSTYKEYTDLQKLYAIKETEVEELKSSLELKAKEDFQLKLENANKESAREKEMLVSEMQQLRYTISRSQEEANHREKMFKDEIAGLQKRLQEADERNEDLTKNMSSTTRPLVRQIENLQATFTTQTISWEKIEKNLTDRLSEAQNQAALISEKERAATERYLEYQSKLTALESQNSTLRQEKMQLSAEIEALKTEIVMLEENKSRETYTLEKVKQNYNSEVTKLKQEKLSLESTMTTCLEQLDVEKRKVRRLEEEIKIKDARALIMSGSSPCPSPTGSARSSVSSLHNWTHDDIHEYGASTPVNNYRMSVYDSLRLGSGSSLLENLQSQLKQREGEILQLQSEIAKLEQVKESMTRELVQLSEQNEKLEKRVDNLEATEKEFKDLDQKYNTLLQMYGEKVEETEELHLDLADVKSMYKAQIEELLTKNKA